MKYLKGNVGTLIITNIRIVWFADMNQQFNMSMPYLTVASVSYKRYKPK